MTAYAFGSPGAQLFPPDSEKLLAEVECPACPWSGTKYVWPMVARFGLGKARMEVPVPTERARCPQCGEHLDPRLRHPSWPGQ